MHTKIEVKSKTGENNQKSLNISSINSKEITPHLKAFYSRLPANTNIHKVCKEILAGNFQFIADAEGNFIIVLVEYKETGFEVTVVRDRYSSQSIFIEESSDKVKISTNLKDFSCTKQQIDQHIVSDLLENRVMSHQSVAKNIQALSQNHIISIKDEVRVLPLPNIGLEIKDIDEKISDELAIKEIKNSISTTYSHLDPDTQVAVLLRGGVASFILAALAQDYFSKVTAYTPTCLLYTYDAAT